MYFSEAVFSDGGVSNIKRYACLANLADHNDGVLTTWSSATEEKANQWKFTQRWVSNVEYIKPFRLQVLLCNTPICLFLISSLVNYVLVNYPTRFRTGL